MRLSLCLLGDVDLNVKSSVLLMIKYLLILIRLKAHFQDNPKDLGNKNFSK